MQRLEVPNSWYPDALPDGKWCAALFEQASVLAYNGRKYDLGMNLLYVRCAFDINGFKFCGQDNAETGNWERDNSAFQKVGDSFGVNPVIYDNNGDLHQVPVGESHQGYRFADESNRIWTGDETRLDTEYGLYEWTRLNGIIVGQFAESKNYPQGGCAFGLNGKRKVLETGTSVNIRMTYADGIWAVAIGKQKEKKSVIYWVNGVDINNLPDWVADESPIPPKPEPPIVIPPKPLPIPEPKYPTARGYKKMEKQDVALILVDGKYISFANNQLNLYVDEINDDCKFELTKPDNLWSLVHKKSKLWLGADATEHTPNVASQLYLIDHRQGYESWNVEHPFGNEDLISAFIIFRRPEGINFSVKLRVVEL